MGLGAAGTAAAIGAAGSIGGSLISNSKGGGTSAATSSSAPWSGVQPYLLQSLGAAQNLYSQGGPQYYPGQTYAGENDLQRQGVAGLANLTPSLAGGDPSNTFFQGLAQGSDKNPGIGTLQDYASGKYLSADNPYFQQMANTLKGNILPGINAQFANAGRGVSGLAARAASEGLGDSIGGLAYQNYQQGLTQQQNAANSLVGDSVIGANGLSSIYQNSLSNHLLASQAALQGGATQQGLDQGALNDDRARYDYNQQLPYQNLQNYIANISGQLTSKGGTTTSTPAQPGFWNQALGAGLGAASFFNQPSQYGGYSPDYTSGMLANLNIPQIATPSYYPGY